MELLTETLRRQLPPLYSQENADDPLIICKFFTPDGHLTWYAIEFDGQDIFFGYIIGNEAELGYFSLSDLQQVRGHSGLFVERDLYFAPVRLSEVQEAAHP